MKSFAVIVAVGLLGCGIGEPSLESGGQGAAERGIAERKAALAATLSDFARGVVTRDEARVLSVLSAERLARVEQAGGIARVMEEQAVQVRRAFGEEADLSSLEIVSIKSMSGDQVLAATVSVRGQELTKPIFFVREGDAYKLNLQPPQTPVASPSSVGTSRQGLEEAGTFYTVANYGSSSEQWGFRATSSIAFTTGWLPPSQMNYPEVFFDHCTNIFLDGTDFKGTNGNGAFWQLPVRCAYQWSGVDFYRPSGSTLWVCTQTCS